MSEKEDVKSQRGPKRVLLLTNSEHGQANVFLATAYALLTLEDEEVEVHFASFPRIQKSVAETSEQVQRDRPGSRPIVFHTIHGKDMVTAWTRPELIAEQRELGEQSSISFVDVVRRTLVLLKVTLPWTGPEFVQIMRSIAGIVRAVQPDITAVDPLFSPGVTVLAHLKARFIILSPNTIKDFAMPVQPRFEALWRYPCQGTNYPFPLPLWAIPLNLLLVVVSLIVTILDPHRRALAAYLASATWYDDDDPSSPPMKTTTTSPPRLITLGTLALNPVRLRRAGIRLLVANLPELEFPTLRTARASHILPCGPILRPPRLSVSAAISTLPGGVEKEEAEEDEDKDARDLAAWLVSGPPVVYVNLGTHVFYDAATATEMATALRRLLQTAAAVRSRSRTGGEGGEGGGGGGGGEESSPAPAPALRVLWKVPRHGPEVEAGWKDVGGVFGAGGAVDRVLGDEVRAGVVRVVEWLHLEPTAVLEAGTVVCAVHHGGANSFLEAVAAGVPQVILPLWMDTFDFARRAEVLGLGRWGNRGADGRLCEGEELGDVLVDVVVGERSSAYAAKARELAALCKRSGCGRVVAARHILSAINDGRPAPSSTPGEVIGDGEKESDRLLGDGGNGHAA